MRRIKEMTECEPAMRTAFISRKQPHENELTILPSFFILPLGLCRFFSYAVSQQYRIIIDTPENKQPAFLLS